MEQPESVETFSEKDFFVKTEERLKVSVPQFLKNMLKICGFDNELSFRNVTSSDLEELEHFARNDLPELITEDRYEEYYGPLYKNHPKKFKLLVGHKKLLQRISDEISANTGEMKTKTKSRPEPRRGYSPRCSSQPPRTDNDVQIPQTLEECSKEVKRLVTNWIMSLKETKKITESDEKKYLGISQNQAYQCSLGPNNIIGCQVSCFVCNQNLKVSYL